MADTPSDPPPDYEKSATGQGTAQRPLRKGPLPLELPILTHLNSKRVILASASPRRKALLQQVCKNSSSISVHVLTLFSLVSQTLRSSHLPSLRILTRPRWDHSNM
jgi:septum formation protein